VRELIAGNKKKPPLRMATFYTSTSSCKPPASLYDNHVGFSIMKHIKPA